MTSPICVIGDTHGHLQLALCMAACWQREQNAAFEAVFLCGDVGTFTSDDQLDKATRRHGKANPCELEFLYLWSAEPFTEWLKMIFKPIENGGLGLTCPVVMVHGNHEGFSYLQTFIPAVVPDAVLDIQQLPTVDSGGFIRYLSSGFRCRTASGKIVGGIGGIERDQRRSEYHELAYLDQSAIKRFLDNPPMDLLITHQGPSSIQGEGGSESLQKLLDTKKMRCWCHGHSIHQPGIVDAGPSQKTRVVPLEDATFDKYTGEPGRNSFATVYFDSHEEPPQVEMLHLQNWYNYRRQHWFALDKQRLVCPDLIRFV
jgi:predicted phosphodiesterase